MATKEEIDAVLLADDAFRHRVSMTHQERMKDFNDWEAGVGKGLPAGHVWIPLSEENRKSLETLLTPASLED